MGEQEPRTTEVIHSITYAEGAATSEPDTPQNLQKYDELSNIDLDNTQEIAEYYMAKNNMIDSDQLEVEKKEKELREDIREVVENKEDLVEYLCNLHASIEVMEERIYELELKSAQKEKQSVGSLRRPQAPGLSGGLSQLPIGLF